MSTFSRFIAITTAFAFTFSATACSDITLTPSEQAESETEAKAQSAPGKQFSEINDILLPAPDNDQLISELNKVLSSYEGSASLAYRSLSSQGNANFSIEGDREHTAASMIKLIILAEVFDQILNGTLSLDDVQTISTDAIVGGSGSMQYWEPGTQTTIKELARAMIAESDNTATNILIDLVGMNAVNEEAGRLGLTHTKLQRRMLDEEARANGHENLMSVDDAATILQAIGTNTFYGSELSSLALDFLTQQSDPSGILAGLPSGTPFAHKTGTLSGVQNDGGIVLSKEPYVLVIFVENTNNANALELMEAASTLVASDDIPTL